MPARFVILVCLLLLAFFAAAQVAHVHPTDTDADHCQLCVALHSAAPVGVTASAIVAVQVEWVAPVFKAHTVFRPWHPDLFNRPPPADLEG
jgi:hypothetical protein